MLRSKETEIQDIRDDLDSLKTHIADLVSRIPSNVVAMGRQLHEDGTERAMEIAVDLKNKTIRKAGQALEIGEDQMRALESVVQANPGKSLLVAFASGLVANMLFSRRS